MENLNHVHLKGTIGVCKIHEINGTKLAIFSVVTNYVFADKNGCTTIESTWHSCKAYEGKDVSLENLEKDAMVELHGRLRNSRYTDADGTERIATEILINSLIITKG